MPNIFVRIFSRFRLTLAFVAVMVVIASTVGFVECPVFRTVLESNYSCSEFWTLARLGILRSFISPFAHLNPGHLQQLIALLMFGGLYELIAYPKTWREYGLFLFGYPASVIFNIIVYLLTLEDIYGSSTWIFWIAGVMYAYALMHHKTLLKRKHGVLLIFLIGVVAGVFLCTIPWNFFGTDPLTNAAHVWGVLVGFLLALLIYGWGRGHMRHMLRLSVLKRVPY